MVSRHGPRATRNVPLRLFLALVLAGPAFAGCGDKGFSYDVPLWKAGYGWEYLEETLERSSVVGDAPGSIEGLANEEVLTTNGTQRFEVFNSTAASVEGIPIYALATLQRIEPDENQSIEGEDNWDAIVFSADINYVEPTFIDWRNQEVQLSSDEGTGDQPTTDEEPASEDAPVEGSTDPNRPQNEFRRLDWPLTKGHEWRHEEPIPQLDTTGTFEAQAVRTYTSRVPAGNFSAVRIEGKLTPDDLSEVEDGVRGSLESQGGEVKFLDLTFVSLFSYAYSPEVMNIVYMQQIDRVVLKARGTDDEGNKYDFTYNQERTVTLRLDRFQLAEGIEKPLTFALDVKRGAYSPKPITPASHLAVEILVTSQSLNRLLDNEFVYLGVRIFNSTANETKVRAADASYPAIGTQTDFKPNYDHNFLEIQWSFQDVDEKKLGFLEFYNTTTDMVRFGAKDVPRPGLKQVQATLKLKDANGTMGQYIYTDSVLFEVYTHGNFTVARNATEPQMRFRFPVFPTATRMTVTGAVEGGGPPETWCAVPNFTGGTQGSADCLRVYDAANRLVRDERQEVMKFENTQLSQLIKGDWRVDYTPAAGNSMKMEIIVRYRPGM